LVPGRWCIPTVTWIHNESRRNPTWRLHVAISTEQMSASAELQAIPAAPWSGSRESIDRLVPLLYKELRAIAHRQIARRPNAATLNTTALVHEAYLKVLDHSRAAAHDRAHLLALASLAMRHVLVNRAIARRRLKRGGNYSVITFDDGAVALEEQSESLLQLDEALSQLAALEPRLARVVECRFFGGLTEEEIAAALGCTVRTVQRDWAKARMLLRRALEP
jgi:RNA polymerase sigma factor (TIGR02999 family)